MTLRTLALDLTVVRERPCLVALPKARVRLTAGNVTSPPIDAVVDTAAHALFARMELAPRLGLDPAALRTSRETRTWTDPDGVAVEGYGAVVTLRLAGEAGWMRFGETLVYFTDAPFGPYPLRLGQVGFLDRVTFTQYGDAQFALDRAD